MPRKQLSAYPCHSRYSFLSSSVPPENRRYSHKHPTVLFSPRRSTGLPSTAWIVRIPPDTAPAGHSNGTPKSGCVHRPCAPAPSHTAPYCAQWTGRFRGPRHTSRPHKGCRTAPTGASCPPGTAFAPSRSK